MGQSNKADETGALSPTGKTVPSQVGKGQRNLLGRGMGGVKEEASNLTGRGWESGLNKDGTGHEVNFTRKVKDRDGCRRKCKEL